VEDVFNGFVFSSFVFREDFLISQYIAKSSPMQRNARGCLVEVHSDSRALLYPIRYIHTHLSIILGSYYFVI